MSKFASRLRELRIHLCQTGASSKGVREFIEQHYVPLKKANPQFPILIRECSGVKPKVWARYEKGEEQAASLKDLSASEVLTKIQSLSK
ncbi:NADH dehydrogenase [ubiquinone] 1 alpha subcomplex subunit 2 [Coccinella septempunctata]|uniref:NADH dehydrogenase [ubiquinone] 1 alpha subcomplex subunit 2 n=1 Tax=Coccinella septempunctata TaxID=41139 RepID=UPI001D065604|nr:NADH dehydrogenase [ubiquinone] 1 alpha subcomplex subunit 2 [Coccinella septempunctata]